MCFQRHSISTIAWEFSKEYVSSPINGVSKPEQLYDRIGSLNAKLSEEEVKYLEEPYTPRVAVQDTYLFNKLSIFDL